MCVCRVCELCVICKCYVSRSVCREFVIVCACVIVCVSVCVTFSFEFCSLITHFLVEFGPYSSVLYTFVRGLSPGTTGPGGGGKSWASRLAQARQARAFGNLWS